MHDSYDGRYVDAWSLGCVVLEQIIGSDEFDVVWLSAYTQELMSRRTDFLTKIKSNTQTLIKLSDFHPSAAASRMGPASPLKALSPVTSRGGTSKLNPMGECVFTLLEPEPAKRMTVQNVLLHPWLADTVAGAKEAPKPKNKLASLKLSRASQSAPNLTGL